MHSQFQELYIKEKVEQSFWSFDALCKSIKRNDTDIIFLDDKGSLVGFLLYQYGYGEAELYYIYVFKKYRAQKKSLKLMEEFINSAFKKDINRIFLEVRETNIVAQNLYKAYGFKLLNRRNNYYKDGETALIFEKVL